MKPLNYVFAQSEFIGLFNHIIRLQFTQKQSRQILLPGLKPLYERPVFSLCRGFFKPTAHKAYSLQSFYFS